MSLRRRLLAVTCTAVLGAGLALVASPADANHTCSTEICYPDLCPQLNHKPYTIFC